MGCAATKVWRKRMVNTPVFKKRYLYLIVLLVVILGLCAAGGVLLVPKDSCSPGPASLRNPPLPSGAEQIINSPSNSTYNEFYEGKRIEFQTIAKPTDVYTFYQQSLSRDGWDGRLWPNQPSDTVDAQFTWSCALPSMLPSLSIYGELRFHAAVSASGKTLVTLNYQYRR